jgi:hypothetical protein
MSKVKSMRAAGMQAGTTFRKISLVTIAGR